jgi:hypothetical protein
MDDVSFKALLSHFDDILSLWIVEGRFLNRRRKGYNHANGKSEEPKNESNVEG